MRRRSAIAALAFGLAVVVVWTGTAAAGWQDSPRIRKVIQTVEPSGPAGFRDVELGTNITECPQAGMNTEPDPLSRIEKDLVWRLSDRGDDTRGNTEYSCHPQNETTIDVNPRNSRNIVSGQNDYRMGGSFSGINATIDGGKHWYDTLHPLPSLQSGEMLDSSGDPAITFDREGTAYLASIVFNRTNDTNGIWVNRSTNGGFTWSRPCVPFVAPANTPIRCGAIGDARHPGDGTVVFQPDNEPTPVFPGSAVNFSVTFHDKEFIGAGPRPAGVTPVCFDPATKAPIPAGSPDCPRSVIGPDRIYVTWTAFNNPPGPPDAIVSSTIEVSYSDDRARSWSPRRTINGSALFCIGAVAGPGHCDDNQFSVPTVSPETGHVYVAFENFNTPDENQWVVVRSRDGGTTWEGPFFITPAFDVNFRGRPDCAARGAGSSLTNSCFRIPMTGAIVADRRGGAFANDVYLVMADNRNGTRENTNTDVFFFKSTNGGSSWIGPTRVNNDDSEAPANRDCGRDLDGQGPLPPEPACPPTSLESATGNDQWWPWIDISDRGDVNVKMLDRRLDTNSVAHEWPTSRQRPGNYLVWTWAAQCRIEDSSLTAGNDCVADAAAVIPQPTGPINPSGPFPGAGPEYTDPFRNFKVSDVPSNFDYCFRAGIFCGDYESIAVGHGRSSRDDDGGVRAVTLSTDARNGRSSGGPEGGTQIPSQPGRNPICEQSDAFFDSFDARNGGSGGSAGPITPFLVTPCPGDENGNGDPDDD
jgi:hypothetical protein